jgi:probable rRNA maturation factor
MGKRASVLFHKPLPPAERDLLCAFAEQLCADILDGRGFELVISDDRQLRELNARFLNHDYATDVLSFPADEGETVGELVISLDRAKAQANEHGHATIDELRILALHGALHLKGMDHETDAGEMRREETHWRAHYGLPAGLIERSA